MLPAPEDFERFVTHKPHQDGIFKIKHLGQCTWMTLCIPCCSHWTRFLSTFILLFWHLNNLWTNQHAIIITVKVIKGSLAAPWTSHQQSECHIECCRVGITHRVMGPNYVETRFFLKYFSLLTHLSSWKCWLFWFPSLVVNGLMEIAWNRDAWWRRMWWVKHPLST